MLLLLQFKRILEKKSVVEVFGRVFLLCRKRLIDEIEECSVAGVSRVKV